MFPILWLALLMAGLQVRPAPRPADAGRRGSISGVVVRSGAIAVTEAPQLGDARVELDPGNVVVYTRAGGGFAFGNLTPGRYIISVRRDGFIPQEDRKRGITPAGMTVTLGAGEALKVELPMVPAPVIIGKVIDPYGRPLAAGLVRAYRRIYTPQGTQLKSVRKGMTNDQGEFRLFGLNFGVHFVSAGYGDRERAAAIGKTQLSSNVSRADNGYVTAFYDDVDDLSRARPVSLTSGSDPGTVNFYLTESARFRIRGQVLPAGADAKIMLAPKGSDLSDTDYFIHPNQSGAFEIRGVSPGSYVLLATAADGAKSSDVITVNVTDTDVDGVRLTLEDTVTIVGELSWSGNSRADFSGLLVKLMRSSIEFEQTFDTRADANGAFAIERIAPSAEYDIAVEPLPDGTYIRSITSAGRTVLSGMSRLSPDQPLQISLATATDTLEVAVTKAGEPAPGVQVVLVPVPQLQRRADRYITGFTGQLGDLQLSAIPPGQYTAYAFEQIEQGAYYALAYNPAAMMLFRERAVPVIVGGNRAKSIQLKVILAAETAGVLQ